MATKKKQQYLLHAEADMLSLGQVLFMEPCVMSRAGIRRVLALHAFHVTRYLGASVIRDIPQIIARNGVDLIIMELGSEDESVFEGLRMIHYLRRVRPLTPLFVSTSLTDSRILQQLQVMQVSGIYLKQDPQEELARCVLQGMGGRIGLSPHAALLLEGKAPPLLMSERELSVLDCLFAGNSVTDAALLLKRDIRTISTQKRNAMSKWGFHNDGELYIWGRELIQQSINSEAEGHYQYLINEASILQSVPPSTLTRAEHDVLQHLFSGVSLTEIAALTHRSIKTISAHKCNSMRKLGVRNNSELFQLQINKEILLRDNRLSLVRSERTNS